ncbi:Uncharacterised protein [Mycobacteroides abscessus subsp. abscessus]|nr:Uncharacterised protein [Mycobacteroides abscessus subsp. abscessus]
MIYFLNSFLVIPYFPIFSSPFHTQLIITNFSGELGDDSTFFSKHILPFMNYIYREILKLVPDQRKDWLRCYQVNNYSNLSKR